MAYTGRLSAVIKRRLFVFHGRFEVTYVLGQMGHDHSAPAVYIFDRDGQSVAGHGKIRGKGVEQDGGATEGDSVFL